MGNRSDVQCRYHYQQLKKLLRKPSKHTKSQHNTAKSTKVRDDKQAVSLKSSNNNETTIESPPLVEGVIKRALPPTQPLTILSPLEPPIYLTQKMLDTAHNIDAFLNQFGY
ncbi:hypothetical protein TVAG_170360 [Trichomonas vaginalis G3]|uniref:HTH myb-type domain-containing protein n=1 Tax=Trichomonas vaginalis (strain ATCC PRA-98 / G3) TaxID=412133 RepID=A2DPH8_TRIV3|nr:RNA polymerase II transcription regulator recruiting protein [Trichomonas vaginalis G3]EAY17722.1 hypothetical protein TVAG_170360 [Trichomonas vaginalis G3]KAI5507874.1 RNA polymerase II transcription regulator recruiting protein [Trichomonas vaginalis G3]|eukprot:XP_001329857.1 hypothetical protein [Trichomonas vaginalis G3]